MGSGIPVAAAHDAAAHDVPSGQILQRPTPLVLVFYPAATARPWRHRRVATESRLNARLLVGTDHVIPQPQTLTLPPARVQIQDAPGFLGEVRVAWEDPVFVTPRLDGVLVEDACDGPGADWLAQRRLCQAGEIPQRLAADGVFRPGDLLTGQGRDLGAVQGGKTWACAPGRPDRRGQTALWPNADARGGWS